MVFLAGDVLISAVALDRGVAAVWIPSQLMILVSDALSERQRDEAVIQLVDKILDGSCIQVVQPVTSPRGCARQRPAGGS